MNFDSVEKIVNAVLYEGYMLYPYRPNSTKNQQRWNFGTLYPRVFAEAQRPPEAFRLVAECLLTASDTATLNIRARCLQIQPHTPSLDVECSADLGDLTVAGLLIASQEYGLTFTCSTSLSAQLQISAQPAETGAIKLRIELANVTPVDGAPSREAVLPLSLTSAHLLLRVTGGEFISLLDPTPQYQQAVSECHSVGVFPVMVGEPEKRDTMLCSSIILYDYPQVAPESSGDFFDATEMDEMLSLRVLTLTEEEKQQMREADPRTRGILERTEALPAEHMMKLHGAIRGLRRVQAEDER